MSRADEILDLVVKAEPYRDIFSGVKPEEYRGESWELKILSTQFLKRRDWSGRPYHASTALDGDFHPYHTARISLGYAADRPSHLRKIRGIRWGTPNPAWCYGIVTAEKCFIIELGDRI